MAAYYNEIDPHAAAWLRELITDGVIAAGDVDERSIAEVTADDLRGYTHSAAAGSGIYDGLHGVSNAMSSLIRHEVTAKITGGHIIVDASCIIQGVRDRISRQVIDTQNTAIREALIKLGWIPPSSTKESIMITLAQIAAKQKELEAMLNEYKALQITHITLAATKIDLAPGERYAGLVFEDGQPHHHLILLPDYFVGEWGDAARWAFNRGGRLPTRGEGAILFANMGKLSSTWIWLLEEIDDLYAWRQFAADCHQTTYQKTRKMDALAVRTVLLDGSAS